MVRFTEKSIIIEIEVGNYPMQVLNYYQHYLIKALMNINENLSQNEMVTMNHYIGGLLESMQVSAEQLEGIEDVINERLTIEDLKEKMMVKVA